MNKLDTKIQEIKKNFIELKKTQFYPVKKNIISQLRKNCQEAYALIDKEDLNSNNVRKRAQIDDIVNKCNQIQVKIDREQKIHPQIGNGGRFANLQISYSNKKKQNGESQSMEQMSKKVARTIIMQQIKSSQLKVSPAEFQKIADRMGKNLQVMKEIEAMIKQQGEDLQVVQSNIIDTYEAAKQANIELQQAAKLKNQSRLMKIRMGVAGIFSLIGLKVLGFPGMIVGFLTGLISTK